MTDAKPGPPAIPRATVRLQLRKGFGFAEATELVPYFAALGVSHIYASPFLMARPGSTHGYDIVDHTRLNPEIGDDAALDRFVAELHAHGLGLIVDFVPNHMGVGGADSPWWLDVLEWGQASPYAGYFDIDWSPLVGRLKGKVLLPFLGDHYGNVLEGGELALRFDAEAGSLSLWYHEHRFPIAVRDYPRILAAALDALGANGGALAQLIAAFGRRSTREQARELKARLATLARQPVLRRAIEQAAARFGQPRALHELLERQSYRLAYWRVASDEINYRRFFDINDLAGLRMENAELFEISHRLMFRLVAEDKVQGLRIDHVDGLYDPAQYCRRLKKRAPSLYLLVEKILAHYEHLRSDWPVDGTTGYDFLNLVNGVFVDAGAESALTEIYRRFIGREIDFAAIVVEAKRQIVQTSLASETNVLANDLHRLAQQSWATRDYTLTSVRRALIEILAHFPVYRTYVTGEGFADEDRRYLDWAVAQARKASSAADPSIFDFLYAALTTDLCRHKRGYRRADVVRTAMKVQQFTGPVMAKAFEDTALYRYHRLVSLNDVGGEPSRFGVTPAAFHHLNHERLRRHPFSLLATATHDHKRGEDVRARINVLSEMPREWARHVRRWARINRRKRAEVDGEPAPSRDDEYLLYQTLVGAWPAESEIPSGLEAFAERIAAYMVKAVREAKRRTSWTVPNEPYEAAVEGFVRAILAPGNDIFLSDFAQLHARIALGGALNGLAQTLLKLTAPGVPDLYQGTELWDLSLVDPDNRRPVDFEARRRCLASPEESPRALLESWRDGRIKQMVISRALALRARLPHVFADGEYQPLSSGGDQEDRVIGFVRRLPDALAATIAPRLAAPLLGDSPVPLVARAAWGDTWVEIPGLAEPTQLRDALTARTLPATEHLPLAEVLAEFPVALLVTA